MRGRERNPHFFQQGRGSGSTNSKGPVKSYMKLARETGHINLSNKNLQECPMDVFFVDDGLEADENFWETNPISKLDLSHNSIRRLPDEVERLAEALQMLKIRDNALVEIPEGLFQCVGLRHLDLAMNAISYLSPAISNLSFLRELFIGNNSLTSLPDAIIHCAGLQTLEAQDNKIRSLPVNFESLSGLVQLNLSSNQLVELPSHLSRMNNLVSFLVKKNQLTYLPDLRGLSKLTMLDASENRIEVFPLLPGPVSCLARVQIGNNRLRTIDMESLVPFQSGCLTELHINDNILSEIPYEIGLLSCCKVLDFSNNNISDIPASIGWMNTLQRFAAEGNPIRSIRRTILVQSTADLKTYLKTRGPPAAAISKGEDRVFTTSMYNDASAIQERTSTSGDQDLAPKFVAQQHRTSVRGGLSSRTAGRASLRNTSQDFEYDPFDPDNQPIRTEDAFTDRLRSMHGGVLELSSMNIVRLPPGFLQQLHMSHAFDTVTNTLAGVNKLDLCENSIKTIPSSILQQFPQLRELLLAGNPLGDGKLAELTEDSYSNSMFPPSLRLLDVSRCRLTVPHLGLLIVGSILPSTEASTLAELRASNNRLDSLPAELSLMSTLRDLRINHNLITSLSSIDFSLLTMLEVIDLSDNKISDVSPLLGLLRGSRSVECPLSSLSLDNNNIREIPAMFAKFSKLKHLGLYGNPQKTIRSNLLGNTDAMLKFLLNRLPTESPSTSEYIAVPAPAVPITVRAESDAVVSTRRVQNNIHSSAPLSSAVDTHALASVRSQYRDSNSSVRDNIDYRLDGRQPSLHPQPPQPYPVNSYGSSGRTVGPASVMTESSVPSTDDLRREIFALEKELDDLSISVSRKTQVKRQLAISRAQLIKSSR